jgi:hypothetical protein
LETHGKFKQRRNKVSENKIGTSSDLRAVLLASIEGVLEGRVNVTQANAVIGLSSELHKSIRQEWDMRVYASENITLHNGKLLKLLDSSDE